MSLLTPVQLFLWIILLELVSVPIIAYIGTWIVNIYFSKKLAHDLDVLKKIVQVIETAKEEWIDKKNNERS